MARGEIQFANFVCKFGTKPMRDHLEDVVLPTFTDDTLIREISGNTTFHFYGVKLGVIGRNARPVIYGRYIKNTKVGREQYFDREAIIRDPKFMESSPSAFFALMVDNHRLAYVPETTDAPSLANFCTTTRKFIFRKYDAWINNVYTARNKPNTPRVTKKSLRDDTPRPTLNIVPLSDPGGILSFLDRYQTLKKIDLRIIDTNDDLDAHETLQALRGVYGDLGSTTTKVMSSARDGHDLAKSKLFLTDVTQHGYQDVKLSGEDHCGHKLTGDNDSFALKAKIGDLPKNDKAAAEALIETFDQLEQNGDIQTGGGSNRFPAFLRQLFTG